MIPCPLHVHASVTHAITTERSDDVTIEILELLFYPLFHFVLHDGVHKIGNQIKDGWRVDVVHTFGADRIGILMF